MPMKCLILLILLTGCASVKPTKPAVLSSGDSISVDAAVDAMWQSYERVNRLTKYGGRDALQTEWVGMFCDAHHWVTVYRSGSDPDAAIQLESAVATLHLISKQAEVKLANLKRGNVVTQKPKWRQ